jgi:hypothetical protein
MITNLRSGIVAGVLAVTTAVAGVGWYRSAHTQNSTTVNGIPYTPATLNSSNGSYTNDPNTPATNAGYNNSGVYAPGTNNCDGTGNYATAHSADYAYTGAPYVSDRYVQSIHRPIRVSYVQGGESYSDGRPYNTGYVEHTRVVERYHHGRSTGKSVAIVAGSAAGGAAIGAIAGGGKGAAIGGLAGGMGGFVYDRLTHNH